LKAIRRKNVFFTDEMVVIYDQNFSTIIAQD